MPNGAILSFLLKLKEEYLKLDNKSREIKILNPLIERYKKFVKDDSLPFLKDGVSL